MIAKNDGMLLKLKLLPTRQLTRFAISGLFEKTILSVYSREPPIPHQKREMCYTTSATKQEKDPR